MKIIDFGEWRFTSAELDKLGPELTAVISTLAFALNEIRVFQILFLSTLEREEKDEVILCKSQIQQGVLLRALNAKVFEGRNCLRASGKIIERKGSADAKSLFARLEQSVFEDDDSLGFKISSEMRNKVINHYVPSETLANLSQISEASDKRLFFHEVDGNSFFPMGEEYVFLAKLNTLAKNNDISVREVLNAWLDWNLATATVITESLQRLLIAVVREVFPDKCLRQRKPYVEPALYVDAKNFELPLFHDIKAGKE